MPKPLHPTLPRFYDLQPPLINDATTLPPHFSDFKVIGKMLLRGKAKNRVTDPKYPWQTYKANPDPAYREKIGDILAVRDKEVDYYMVTRRQYWALQTWKHYAVDTNVQVTHHRGVILHRAHVIDKSKSVTERLAIELGIDLSPGGDVPPDVPPPAAMAEVFPAPAPLDDNGGGGGGGGGGGENMDFSFSREMTKSLHLTDTSEETYTDETTDTITQDFKGNTTYLYWQKMEQTLTQRVGKGTLPAPMDVAATGAVSALNVFTGEFYIDSFPKPKDDNGGHIH